MLTPIILSVVIVSLISFAGVITLSVKEKLLHKWMLVIVSFAAGTLIATAFFNQLPKAVNRIGDTAFNYALLGIVGFFLMERFIFWHHCHTHDHEVEPYTYLNLVGDGVHNFVDGAIIAAAYLTNFHLGLVTTVAIALHEIPQEIGDFAILIHGGFGKWKALAFNFLSAITSVGGAVLMYLLSGIENSIPILIAIAAGGFTYIAAADLFPEMQRETNAKEITFETIALLLGIALIFYI